MFNSGWKDKGQNSASGSFSGAYRPWGQVRRRNLMARIRHILIMSALGLISLAVLCVTVVFAASIAVIGAVACALLAVMTLVMRRVAKVRVRAEHKPQAQPNGVFNARKVGNTWITY